MATPTREETHVARNIKRIKDSLNLALRDLDTIDVQGSNTMLLQTSYANKIREIRACKAYVKDAINKIKDIPA